MWAPWRTLFCVLLIFSLLTITEVDSKNSKKKKKSKEELSKGKSSKEKSPNGGSSPETSTDVNPKMKAIQTKPAKKKDAKKVQDDAQNIPTLNPDIPDIIVQQEKLDHPVDSDRIITTSVQDPQANNCSAGSVQADSIGDIEKKVTALWSQVNAISNPVHIHVHGGRVSSPSHHHGIHGSDDKVKNWDRKDQGHHRHCQKCAHSTSKQHPAVKDGDHSIKTHSHHNESSSHGDHGHFHGGHDHTGHHHSSAGHGHSHGGHNDSHGGHDHTGHHHSSAGHGHSHGGHNESQGGHGHRHGDHSDKGHHHFRGQSHGHGHSPSKGHDHRRGYSFGESRGHSTHVHIHVTIDEKPGSSSGVPSTHEHSDNSTSVPASEEAIYARCDVHNYDANNHLQGYVLLRQSLGVLEVKINISGFEVPPAEDVVQRVAGEGRRRNLRGFHVHQYGDFSQGCTSFGGHYNPEGVHHGGLEHSTRHVGDWGNIEVDDQGVAISHFSVKDATLRGPHSILGRGIVVHGQPDDLGEGGNIASHSSGNAGARLGCCIISQTKPVPDEIWAPHEFEEEDIDMSGDLPLTSS